MKLLVHKLTPNDFKQFKEFAKEYTQQNKKDKSKDHFYKCTNCFMRAVATSWVKPEEETPIDTALLPAWVRDMKVISEEYEGTFVNDDPYIIIDGKITPVEDISETIGCEIISLDAAEQLREIEKEHERKPKIRIIRGRVERGGMGAFLAALLSGQFNPEDFEPGEDDDSDVSGDDDPFPGL